VKSVLPAVGRQNDFPLKHVVRKKKLNIPSPEKKTAWRGPRRPPGPCGCPEGPPKRSELLTDFYFFRLDADAGQTCSHPQQMRSKQGSELHGTGGHKIGHCTSASRGPLRARLRAHSPTSLCQCSCWVGQSCVSRTGYQSASYIYDIRGRGSLMKSKQSESERGPLSQARKGKGPLVLVRLSYEIRALSCSAPGAPSAHPKKHNKPRLKTQPLYLLGSLHCSAYCI
jgi:hypothetical protein